MASGKPSPYEQDLDRNPANYAPLTPLTFIEWSASVYPERTAVIHGARRFTWSETYARAPAARLGARAPRHRRGRHRRGDAREHARDVRVPLRRADDRRGAQHAQHAARRGRDRLHARPRRGEGADHRPRVRRHDRGRVAEARPEADRHRRRRPGVRRPRRAARARPTTRRSSRAAIPAFAWQPPADEWQAISLNYTSGTTGNPKGVVYSPSRRVPERRSATSSPGACRGTRSTCGRCRCSTATAGASRGPWRRTPAPTSACARSTPR